MNQADTLKPAIRGSSAVKPVQNLEAQLSDKLAQADAGGESGKPIQPKLLFSFRLVAQPSMPASSSSAFKGSRKKLARGIRSTGSTPIWKPRCATSSLLKL